MDEFQNIDILRHNYVVIETYGRVALRALKIEVKNKRIKQE